MYCGADYDGATKCLRRGFCDPCWMNDNCTGGNDACVPTADGSARHCTKSCGSPYDCGGAQGSFLSCAATTDSLGASGIFCLHKFGAWDRSAIRAASPPTATLRPTARTA